MPLMALLPPRTLPADPDILHPIAGSIRFAPIEPIEFLRADEYAGGHGQVWRTARATRLQQQYLGIAVGGQTIGEDAPCGPATDDDVIVSGHFLPVS